MVMVETVPMSQSFTCLVLKEMRVGWEVQVTYGQFNVCEVLLLLVLCILGHLIFRCVIYMLV